MKGTQYSASNKYSQDFSGAVKFQGEKKENSNEFLISSWQTKDSGNFQKEIPKIFKREDSKYGY